MTSLTPRMASLLTAAVADGSVGAWGYWERTAEALVRRGLAEWQHSSIVLTDAGREAALQLRDEATR